MKAIHIALLWLLSFAAYAVVVILMYALVPAGDLFALYEKIAGPVPGAEWDNMYNNLIILGRAAITFLLVWLVAFVAMRRSRR
ncbi:MULTISPECIES: hypothetical protein [Lelliottia]|uniref:Uncharacterized protein n=1 Tax=Lelliottia wanjuensis TaxID=3050585 RepID=A0AAP4FWC4_9ENTR|nr:MULTISPECIES: hypothetical protein [unclassified Lelliottia]MDK9362797.1 hypothetical protein [Lelliottia sp. V106_12]MDK9583304.1 hypothetical protein [Lelliottia sp. V86_10]MDK9615185.1 hypothetical protein [Lelliottia sp. V106_9]